MEYQCERCDRGEQDPQRPGKNIHRILAGTPSAVGQCVHQFHGFHTVDAEDSFNHEQRQDQHDAEKDRLRKGCSLQHRPFRFNCNGDLPYS